MSGPWWREELRELVGTPGPLAWLRTVIYIVAAAVLIVVSGVLQP